MRQRGYFGIAVYKGKNSCNYGTLYRSANILGASFICMIGKRFKYQSSDTLKSDRHIPLYEFDTFEEFKNNMPHKCRIVAVELTDKARDLKDFVHPEQCCYLLGAEDNGIPESILSQCHNTIRLMGDRSMNLAVAGSIVLYHRMAL